MPVVDEESVLVGVHGSRAKWLGPQANDIRNAVLRL